MEQLAHLDRLWYRLGHERAIEGRQAVRIWMIECKKCGHVHTLTPGSSSDEAIRKSLMRAGWDLGRRPRSHLCPICTGRAPHVQRGPHIDSMPKEANAPAPPASSVAFFDPPSEEPDDPFLVEAWKSCDQTERDEFVKFLGPLVAPPPPPRRESWLEVWIRTSAAERTAFLDKHRPIQPPQSLIEKFNSSSPAQIEEFVVWFGDRFKPQIIRGVSLTEMWNVANDKDRGNLLDWLRTTGMIPTPAKAQREPLFEYFNASPEPERDDLIGRILRAAGVDVAEDGAMHVPAPQPTSNKLPGTITKSEFARELGIAPSNISLYLGKGMPQRPDGRLDRDIVHGWVKTNVGQQGGNRKPRAEPPPGLDNTPITSIDFADNDAIAALSNRLWPS